MAPGRHMAHGTCGRHMAPAAIPWPSHATDGTWPQVFELADAHTVETEVYSEGGTTSLSDGTSIWWAASQLGSTADSLQPMPPPGLADEALNEWLQFFAGHSTRRRRASE